MRRGPVTTLVVPCYDEAARLPVDDFARAVSDREDLRLLFVDDGSRDGTRGVLDALAARLPDRVGVLALPTNRGKAEAVRLGVLRAFEAPDVEAVGFWDADLATPLDAVDRFLAVLDARPEVEIVLGSRVALLGHDIGRDARRHYVGRIGATGASALLGLPVYDTQCGAKLFRARPRIVALWRRPFLTRWAFDVELLARWLEAASPAERRSAGRFIVELPLTTWHDVPGSKLRWSDVLRAPLDLLRIGWAHPGIRAR